LVFSFLQKGFYMTYRINSSPLLYMPGILNWAINGYKFNRDREAIRRVLTEGCNMTDECADALLSERVPFVVVDDAVEFDYDGTVFRETNFVS
jgi:hypothetical protein